MSPKTKEFYYILRTPSKKDLQSFGVLYSTPRSQYVRVKASFCVNTSEIICMPK